MNINDYNNMMFVSRSLETLGKFIFFCDPYLEDYRDKIVVKHPPKEFGDISTNALMFTKDKEEFIESLKMFVPHEKMEVKNGMLNIWFKTKDMVNVAKIY